jgi:hypothetical protein
MSNENNYTGLFIFNIIILFGCIFFCKNLRNNELNRSMFFTSNINQNSDNELSEILINNNINENYN